MVRDGPMALICNTRQGLINTNLLKKESSKSANIYSS